MITAKQFEKAVKAYAAEHHPKWKFVRVSIDGPTKTPLYRMSFDQIPNVGRAGAAFNGEIPNTQQLDEIIPKLFAMIFRRSRTQPI